MFLLASAYPWTSWPCHSPRDPCFLEMNVHRNQMIREITFALRLRTHRIDLTWTGACDRGRVLLISIEINICQQTCDIPRPLHWPHWPYPYWFQCSEIFDDVAIFDLNNLINLRGPQMQICFEAFGTQTFLDPFACNGAIFLPLRTVNSCFEWLRVESNLFQSHSIFRPSGYPSQTPLLFGERSGACWGTLSMFERCAISSAAQPSQTARARHNFQLCPRHHQLRTIETQTENSRNNPESPIRGLDKGKTNPSWFCWQGHFQGQYWVVS